MANNAAVALYDAEQALREAERVWQDRKDSEETDHLAYLIEKRVEIAQAVAQQNLAALELQRLSNEREQIQIEARKREAEQARREAEIRAREAEQARKEAEARAREAEQARMQTETSRREAERARKEAEVRAREAEQARMQTETSRREAERARKEAEVRAREAEQARTQTEARRREAEQAQKEAEARRLEAEKAQKEVEARNREIERARKEAEEAQAKAIQAEKELADLKARETERGLVLNLGDVLFEFAKADLKPGALRNLYPLVTFLKEYPERKVLIEGHTDNVGSESFNLDLSQRRANSVRGFLTENGIDPKRITAQGYGERYPVTSNSVEAGRQQNRRVEVVILREGESVEERLRKN